MVRNTTPVSLRPAGSRRPRRWLVRLAAVLLLVVPVAVALPGSASAQEPVHLIQVIGDVTILDHDDLSENEVCWHVPVRLEARATVSTVSFHDDWTSFCDEAMAEITLNGTIDANGVASISVLMSTSSYGTIDKLHALKPTLSPNFEQHFWGDLGSTRTTTLTYDLWVHHRV